MQLLCGTAHREYDLARFRDNIAKVFPPFLVMCSAIRVNLVNDVSPIQIFKQTSELRMQCWFGNCSGYKERLQSTKRIDLTYYIFHRSYVLCRHMLGMKEVSGADITAKIAATSQIHLYFMNIGPLYSHTISSIPACFINLDVVFSQS